MRASVVRSNTHRPVILGVTVTAALGFAVLYPVALSVGILISAVKNEGYSWGRGPIFAIVVVVVAALTPVAASKYVVLRPALTALASLTTILTIVLIPVFLIGVPLAPLAVAQWSIKRRLYRSGSSEGALRAPRVDSPERRGRLRRAFPPDRKRTAFAALGTAALGAGASYLAIVSSRDRRTAYFVLLVAMCVATIGLLSRS